MDSGQEVVGPERQRIRHRPKMSVPVSQNDVVTTGDCRYQQVKQGHGMTDVRH